MRDHPPGLIASKFWCCTFEELNGDRRNCAAGISKNGTAAALVGEQLELGSVKVDERAMVLPHYTLPAPSRIPDKQAYEEICRQVEAGRADTEFAKVRRLMLESRPRTLSQWIRTLASSSEERVERRLTSAGMAHLIRPRLRLSKITVPLDSLRNVPAGQVASQFRNLPPRQITSASVLLAALFEVTGIDKYVFQGLPEDDRRRMNVIVAATLRGWPAASMLIAATRISLHDNSYAH